MTNLRQQLGQSIDFHSQYTKRRHKICFVFWKSEPKHAYKRYAYKKHQSICKWFRIHGSHYHDSV